jgi:hypothetical protein
MLVEIQEMTDEINKMKRSLSLASIIRIDLRLIVTNYRRNAKLVLSQPITTLYSNNTMMGPRCGLLKVVPSRNKVNKGRRVYFYGSMVNVRISQICSLLYLLMTTHFMVFSGFLQEHPMVSGP